MDKNLKEVLEDLANRIAEEIQSSGDETRRIVLHCSKAIRSPTLVLNYTENALLNRPAILQNRIKISKQNYLYRKDRHGQEGDFPIDLYTYLEQFDFKDSAFWV